MSPTLTPAASELPFAPHPTRADGWRHIVLGADAKHALRLQRTVLAGAFYAIAALLAALGVWGHLVGPEAALITTAYNFGGFILFYTLMRSGVTLRLRDPALTFWQMLHGLGAIVLIYAVIDVARPMTMPMISLALSFGLYRLNPRQTVATGILTLIMLGAVLLHVWWHHTGAVELRDETFNIALASLTLPIFMSVSRQVAQTRRRLVEQKEQLAQTIEALRAQATRDGLTGLGNRRSMTAKLAEEELRFRRHRRPFCVAMLDIDHFKRINDACGHQEGDRVLQAFARLAQRHFPAPDQVARWGGEEFVALMPESDLAAATATLEAMLDEADIRAGVDGRSWRVTFCAGVAQARAGEPVSELLKRADAALYRGKAEGRNRIVGAQA